MYRPKDFVEADPAKIKSLMRNYPFVTIVTQTEDGPLASHLPVIHEDHEDGRMTILGHMARANPQWKHFKAKERPLIIFQGPHAYISPDWYEDSFIPTWNYAVIHIRGSVTIIEDPKLLGEILEKTITIFEPGSPKPWRQHLSETLKTPKLRAIVGFSIEIEQLEAKFKMSQNRSEKDILGVIKGLEAQSDNMSQQMKDMMLSHYKLD